MVSKRLSTPAVGRHQEAQTGVQGSKRIIKKSVKNHMAL
jgi:hypothetical protein